jgi:hypothetical protein
VKTVKAKQAKAWARQWAEAGKALAEERRASLAALTDADAAVIALALLDLGASLPPDPARHSTSGFVEQQALFHRRRTP